MHYSIKKCNFAICGRNFNLLDFVALWYIVLTFLDLKEFMGIHIVKGSSEWFKVESEIIHFIKLDIFGFS